MGKAREDIGSSERSCPSELGGPLPRKVELISHNATLGLVVVLVLMVFSGVACGDRLFATLSQLQQRSALQRDGREIVGRVTRTHSGRGPAHVSYTFVINGSAYVGDAQLPNYRLVLHQSDQISVRYLPPNPSINHPADWEWSGFMVMDIVIDLFALFPGVLGGIALVSMLGDRRLARIGTAADGQVTECKPNKSEFRVEYRFCTGDGTWTSGACGCSEEYETGDRIWILYLPNKPQRNHSYPLEFFGVVESLAAGFAMQECQLNLQGSERMPSHFR